MVISELSHCALIVLVELSLHYRCKGCTVLEIADKNHIPLQVLEPVVKRLHEMNFLTLQKGNSGEDQWLLLRRNPQEIFAYDVISLFEQEPFSGRFFDNNSGRSLPESNIASLINMERNHVMRYLRQRFKRINIECWSDKIRQYRAFYSVSI